MTLLERFLNYVKIDTQSDELSETTPSTLKQYDLLNLLKKELDDLGIESEIDQYGRLYAFIPGNEELTPIGLCSHVDTALECSGKDVKPQIIKDYDLKDIPLGKSGIVLSPKETPKLNELKGKTLITTDGTTLLGGDDKAGVAIIMDVASRLVKLPKEAHNPCYILFTPDEEIGRGPEHFDTNKFKCKYAYTIDGGDPKYLAFENFNAKSCDVEVTGKSIHPGDAKGIMVNAILVLNDFISMLPKDMTPAKTSGRKGFNHVTSIEGKVEKAHAHIILRNHDLDILNSQVETLKQIAIKVQEINPNSKIELCFKDSYFNMNEIIKKHPDCKDHIEKIYNHFGIKFEYEAIRGGTDGASFSFKGVPTPNLGTGSYNHHSKTEFAVLEEMQLMSSLVEAIFTLK